MISVETAARRKAKVIGKPERYMFDCMKLWYVQYVAGTPLYTWVKRDKVELSSLTKETT